MIGYIIAAGLIVAAYLVGLKLKKWQARAMIVAAIVFPFFIVTEPLWRGLGDLDGEDAGMAAAFLLLSLFPYSIFVALVLAAYLFGKSNKVDMIS